LVEVIDGVTRVQVGRGKAGRVLTVLAQSRPRAVVVVRAGHDPAIDGGGVFVRGINFGEGVVTIDRNQWLPLAEGLGAYFHPRVHARGRTDPPAAWHGF
jgi:hypothetical protein